MPFPRRCDAMSIKRGYQMLKAAVADFSRDDAMSLAAALAF